MNSCISENLLQRPVLGDELISIKKADSLHLDKLIDNVLEQSKYKECLKLLHCSGILHFLYLRCAVLLCNVSVFKRYFPFKKIMMDYSSG